MLSQFQNRIDDQIQNSIDAAYCDFISDNGSPEDIFDQPLRRLQADMKNSKLFSQTDIAIIEGLFVSINQESQFWKLLIDILEAEGSSTSTVSFGDDVVIKIAISWFEDTYKMAEDNLGTALINSNRFIQESPNGPDGLFFSASDDFKLSEAIVAKILFQYVRSGRVEEAKKMCYEEAPWCCLLLEKSDSDTWRGCCRKMSQLKTLSNYEVALFGVLCGNYEAVLPVCADWKDCTWAALSCLATWRLDLSFCPSEGLISPELGHLLTEGALFCYENNIYFNIFRMVVLSSQSPVDSLEKLSDTKDLSILRFLVHLCILRGRDESELLSAEIFQKILLRYISTVNSWRIALKYTTFLSADFQIGEICKIYTHSVSCDPKNGRFCFTLCRKYGLPVVEIGIRLLASSESCDVVASMDWMLNLPGHVELFVDVLNGVLLKLVENEEYTVLPLVFEKMTSVDFDFLQNGVVFQRFMFFQLLSRSKESYDTWFRSYESEFGDLIHVNFELAIGTAYEFIECALDLEGHVFTGRLGRVRNIFVVESCLRLAQMYETMGEARGLFDLIVFVAGSDRMIFKCFTAEQLRDFLQNVKYSFLAVDL